MEHESQCCSLYLHIWNELDYYVGMDKEINMDFTKVQNKDIEKEFARDTGNSRKKRGRPIDKVKVMNKELTSRYEGERVVPMYDVSGGDLEHLTPYEHKFVICYTSLEYGGNAAEAAKAASTLEDRKRPRNWNKVGYDLLRRPSVRKAIGFMQKKICVAAALDSDEVISNIREIATLALMEGKFEAALKANQVLGEFLGILGNNKPGPKTIMGTATPILDIFSNGRDGEIEDKRHQVKVLSKAINSSIGMEAGDTPSLSLGLGAVSNG